jgi:AmmeMemoRadiSam system protein B/AmmeMemoRadiSam system protein A
MQNDRFTTRCLAFAVALMLATACAATPPAEPTLAPTAGALAPPTATLAPAASQTATPDAADIHYAQGPGRWYPADPDRLQAAVEAYVSDAGTHPVPGRLVAVIVPHAGYIYSGAVAGHAFRALQEAGCAGKTVVVIGDTHSGHGTSQIAVWPKGSFHTPLGTIPVHEEFAQALVAADPHIEAERRAFIEEHPVENQLPFIQVVCPGARIVPIVVRQPSLQNAQILANAVIEALDGPTAGDGGLIVASTDLSHYYPYETARQIDEVALRAIGSLDPQEIADSPRRCTELGIEDNPSTMCSMGAVLAAVIAARQMGADRATVLDYANSGDSPIGDRAGVVGYGAVALWQSKGEEPNTRFELPPTPAAPVEPLLLSDLAKTELLRLARYTAEHFLATQAFPAFQSDDPALLQPLGAYVTYEHDGELRGCVGRIEADRPVYLNVQYAAVVAAVLDSRFPAITPDELEDLSLEITLLHQLEPVADPEEIELGKDGILMRVGDDHSALFLPQVPSDQDWDLETTLSQLSLKAGLAVDGWQDEKARFYTFEGEWFGEED